MKSRTAFILFGFGLALVGYALTYSGMTSLNPLLSPTGEPVSTIDALLPGKLLGNLSGGRATAPRPGQPGSKNCDPRCATVLGHLDPRCVGCK